MTVRKVLRAGDPSLRRVSEPYPLESLGNGTFERLVHDMFETMHDYSGVGLSAPQVQETVRVIVYEIRETERYESLRTTVPPTVMVNPEITERSESRTIDWEGCLSLPSLRGKVPRSEWVEVTYRTRDGEKCHTKLEGFEARVVQHELDHLEGQLFVDRMETMESLCFFEEYRRFHAEESSDDR